MPDDGRQIDSSMLIDAPMLDGPPIDAPPPPPPTPAREIVPGGTRMTGGGFTFDVQLGHPIGQQRGSGTTLNVEGNAGVKP